MVRMLTVEPSELTSLVVNHPLQAVLEALLKVDSKVVDPAVEMVVNPTPSSSETLVSEVPNKVSKTISSKSVPLALSESPWARMAGQEVSPTLSSLIAQLPRKLSSLMVLCATTENLDWTYPHHPEAVAVAAEAAEVASVATEVAASEAAEVAASAAIDAASEAATEADSEVAAEAASEEVHPAR